MSFSKFTVISFVKDLNNLENQKLQNICQNNNCLKVLKTIYKLAYNASSQIKLLKIIMYQ